MSHQRAEKTHPVVGGLHYGCEVKVYQGSVLWVITVQSQSFREALTPLYL